MPATYAVADTNGAVIFWGPAQSSIRPLPARQSLRALLTNDEPFGDMNGPLSYWGPAPARDELPAARVA